MIIKCLMVGLGGFIGSVLRYLISLIPINESFVFPIKTLITNVIGAFVIGIIVSLSLKSIQINENLTLFLKVGLCGGFTTFSTFALESTNLFQNNHIGLSILYIILSVSLSILAVYSAELIMA